MNQKQPAFLGKKAFAESIGQSPSHVTKLIKEGRIVLDGSGRNARVKVADSMALMQQTGGGRQDVADRHTQHRASKAQTQAGQGQPISGDDKSERGPTAQAGGGNEGQVDKIGSSYQAARAVKEKYAALTAKAEYEALVGSLVPKEDVELAMRFIGATVRSLMDVFPDQNAPVLCAVTDIHETHAILSDACRNVLADVGQAVERQQQAITRQG